MHRFRELKVWQRAMHLVVDVYRHTQAFPAVEQFGLTSQLRRAAAAIPLNISEGAGSGSDPEFRRFLRIALRSCYELETGLEIGRRLGYGTEQSADRLINETHESAGMIIGLGRRLSRD